MWKDQGWGNNKGGIEVTQNSSYNEVIVDFKTGAPRPGYGPRRQSFIFSERCDNTESNGDEFQALFRVGGGGGHEFDGKDFIWFTIPNLEKIDLISSGINFGQILPVDKNEGTQISVLNTDEYTEENINGNRFDRKYDNIMKSGIIPDGEYKLFSRKHRGSLFCGDGPDGCKDHWARVERRPGIETEENNRWHIRRQSDGTYKLFNGKHKGPLFCGDATDRFGDHWVRVESNTEYENDGQERWRIEKQYDGSFKLFNVYWNTPLFCGKGRDSIKNQWAWVYSRKRYQDEDKEKWKIKLIAAKKKNGFRKNRY